MTARGLTRPNQIWVYDFVAALSDMPADSSLAGRVGTPGTPPTLEEIEAGRTYGAMIAQQLVKDIQAMGLPAIEAVPGSSPQVGDGVIRGYIVSIEGGGTSGFVKRMVIGFGAGTAEMDTVVEGYVMTSQGLRRLGSGTLTSSGNKSPGLVVPAAVAVATANPVGLIVVGGARSTEQRAADRDWKVARRLPPTRLRLNSGSGSRTAAGLPAAKAVHRVFRIS
jgi:uncharacterized protein YaiE (UPF0345 family)